MKNIKTILLLLIPAMLLFSSCPSGVNYSAAEGSTEKIDKRLLGDWATTTYTADFRKMKISKKNRKSFKVIVGEVSKDYEEKTKGYTVQPTTIGGEKFLSAKPNSKGSKINYIYHYEFVGENLITYSLAFDVETKKTITSTKTLREEIKNRIVNKKHKFNKVVWKKK